MVLAPEKVIIVLSDPEEGQAHQRRLGQIKPPCAVVRQERHHPRLLLVRGEIAPVFRHPGQIHAPLDDLDRRLETFPHEDGSEGRMPIHDLFPSALEGRNVEVTMEGEDRLLDVHPRIGIVQSVEQHTLLHRREPRLGPQSSSLSTSQRQTVGLRTEGRVESRPRLGPQSSSLSTSQR